MKCLAILMTLALLQVATARAKAFEPYEQVWLELEIEPRLARELGGFTRDGFSAAASDTLEDMLAAHYGRAAEARLGSVERNFHLYRVQSIELDGLVGELEPRKPGERFYLTEEDLAN